MPPDTENFLALEIKREIAERYFGFRKIIEEDTHALLEKIDAQLLLLEKGISYKLIRLYILFRDEALIDQFMELTGWREKVFYEPNLTESSSIREKVFQDIKIRGFTKFGRFKNLVFDTYERLEARVELYRQNLEEIKTSRETINHEIDLFYRENDIGNIMGFLRSMEGTGSQESMGVTPEAGSAETLEHKMRIEKPPPLDQELITLPRLASLTTIRKELKKLCKKAYKHHGEKILTELTP